MKGTHNLAYLFFDIGSHCVFQDSSKLIILIHIWLFNVWLKGVQQYICINLHSFLYYFLKLILLNCTFFSAPLPVSLILFNPLPRSSWSRRYIICLWIWSVGFPNLVIISYAITLYQINDNKTNMLYFIIPYFSLLNDITLKWKN